MMTKLDPFTSRRILKAVATHREKTGQLPTFADLEAAGFAKDLIKEAIRSRVIEEFYVTLTNGTVVKGFKPVT